MAILEWMRATNPNRETSNMVERRSELKRRYHRKKKMRKLKDRLEAAKNPHDKEAVLKKIHILSPWWDEAVLKNA
jgi:hypothetical protein